MDDLSRRKMLLLSGAGMLSACGGGGGSSTVITPPPPPPPPPATLSVPPIGAAAAAKNMRFGTAVNVSNTFLDNGYTGLMQEHCNVAVSENEHKWTDIRRNPPPDFQFQNGDTLVSWAQTNNIEYRFHVLLWEVEARYPGWFSTYNWGRTKVLRRNVCSRTI